MILLCAKCRRYIDGDGHRLDGCVVENRDDLDDVMCLECLKGEEPNDVGDVRIA
jgi:hypothetical protein